MQSDGARTRRVAWSKVESGFGAEWAEITLATGRLDATGVAIGTDPVPYRLDYRLETTAGFVTTRLDVRTQGEGWQRSLDLRRTHAGAWVAESSAASEGASDPGSLPAAGATAEMLRELDEALDCDLGLCPVTNSMPV